jgi:hypothetical protein
MLAEVDVLVLKRVFLVFAHVNNLVVVPLAEVVEFRQRFQRHKSQLVFENTDHMTDD